jgi:hypothetical protein
MIFSKAMPFSVHPRPDLIITVIEVKAEVKAEVKV